MQERPTTEIERKKAWNYALGMIKIDGLTPSKDFLQLVEKEIKGEITPDDIKKYLDKKYYPKETGVEQ